MMTWNRLIQSVRFYGYSAAGSILHKYMSQKQKQYERQSKQFSRGTLESLEPRQLMTTLYWDTSSSAGIQSGNGSWDLTSYNWNTKADGTGERVKWSDNSDAVFLANGTSEINLSSSGINAASITFSGSGYTIKGGTLTLNGSAAITTNQSAKIHNNIAGSSGLAKYGAGTLTLYGLQNYSGTTNIDSGTLLTTHGLGSGNIVINGSLNLNVYQTVTINNQISGSGNLYVNAQDLGTGGLVLNSENTFSGITRILHGTLSVNNNKALQYSTVDMNGSDNGYFGFGTLSDSTVYIGGLSGSRQINWLSTNYMGGLSLVVGGSNASTVYSGKMDDELHNVTKTGTGTLTLLGGCSYRGTVTIEQGGTLQIGNGGQWGELAWDTQGIVNNGTLIFNRNNTIYLDNRGDGYPSISGSGNLIQAGSGTLVLNVANTFNGTTKVLNGVLKLTNSSALSKSTLDTDGNGRVDFGSLTSVTVGGLQGSGNLSLMNASQAAVALTVGNNGNNTVFNGVLSGSGRLVKVGAGNLTLAGDNTYTGTTTVSGGTLTIGNGGTTGSISSGAIANAAALVFSRSDVITVDNLISGSGTVTQLGSGTLILTGTNSYSGATAISNGTIQVGNGGSTGSISNTSAVTNNGTLIFNLGTNYTFSKVISGTGNLTQAGSGELILGGSNTFSGTTFVASGQLTLNNQNALAQSTLNTSGAGALSLGNLLTVYVGGLDGTGYLTLQNASATAVALNVGANGSSTVYRGVINGSGSLTKTGSGILTLAGENTYAGTTTISTGALSIGDGGTSGRLGNGDVTIASGAGIVFNRSNDLLVSNVIASKTSGAGTLTQQGIGRTILVGANTSYSGVTTINDGTLQVGNGGSTGSWGSATSAIINNGTLTFNLNTNLTLSQVIAGTGNLMQAGSAQLTLSASNTFTGVTRVDHGTLLISKSDSLSYSTLDTSGAGTFSFGALTSVKLGGLQGSGGLVLAAAVTLSVGNNNSDTIFGGNISGAGNLTKMGSGKLTVTGANTYTGSTTVSAGTLSLNGASFSTVVVTVGATLRIASSSTIGALSGAGFIDLLSSGDSLYVGSANTNTTFSGVISGNGYLFKEGTGILTLSGANTFSGKAEVLAGTISVSNSLALQNCVVHLRKNAGTVTFGVNAATFGALEGDGDLQLKYSSGGTTLTVGYGSVGNADYVYSGVMSSTGGIIKIGDGKLTLTGANTYSGATTINGGTLALGDSGTTGIYGTGAVTNNAKLVFNRSDTVELGKAIGGTGNLVQEGAGKLLLKVANTFTGDTLINNGSLQLGVANALGRSNLDTSGAGSFSFGTFTTVTLGGLKGTGNLNLENDNYAAVALTVGYDSRETTFAGVLSGAGSLIKATAGTLILSPSVNSYVGAITINAGTLICSGSSVYTESININAGTLVIGDGGTSGGIETFSGSIVNKGLLVVDRSDEYVLRPIISSSGKLEQRGTGTLILANNNTYTGITTVSNGTLQIGYGDTWGKAGSGAIVNNSNVVCKRSDNIDLSNVMSGTGNFIQAGSGNLRLTGANTFTGITRIDSGSLTLGSGSVLSGSTFDTDGNGYLSFDKLTAATFGGIQGSKDLYLFNEVYNENTYEYGRVTLTVGGNNKSTECTGTTGGNLIKVGTGNLKCWGVWEGSFTVKAGTVDFQGSADSLIVSNVANVAINLFGEASFGSISGGGSTGGTIHLNDYCMNVGWVEYLFEVRDSNSSYAGIISGAGGINKYGIGTLTLSAANTFTGDTNIYDGKITLSNSSALQYSKVVNDSSLDNALAFGGLTSATIAGLEGEGLITLSGSNGGVNLTISTNQVDISYYGTIAGTGGITKVGDYDLLLYGDLTYSGRTTVSGGGIGVYSGTFGNGAVVVNSNCDLVFMFDGVGEHTFANVFSGSGLIEIWGSSSLNTNVKLTGASTFSGVFSVGYNCTLEFGSAKVLQSATVDVYRYDGSLNFGKLTGVTVGELQGGGDICLENTVWNDTTGTYGAVTLTVGGNNTDSEYYGSISGGGSIVKIGTGTFTLSGSNTFSGNVTVNGGGLTLWNGNTISDWASVVLAKTAGVFLELVNDEKIGSIGSTGSGTGGNILLNDATLYVGYNDTSTTFSGVISGSGNLCKDGLGTLTLSNVNTYTGVTEIWSGELVLTNADAINKSTLGYIWGNGVLNIGTLKKLTLGGLIGWDDWTLPGTASAPFNLTIGTNDSDTTFYGTLNGYCNVTKVGSGTLTLAGNNTYIGKTTVDVHGGQLNVTGSLNNNVGNTVEVRAGAVLGGCGTIGSTTRIMPDGGLNLTQGLNIGNIILDSSSELEVAIDGDVSGGTFGQLITQGTVSLGNATLNVSGTRSTPNGQTLVIIANDGTDAISGKFMGLDEGAFININGLDYVISYRGGDGNDVTLRDVVRTPENLSATPINLNQIDLSWVDVSGDEISYTIERSLNGIDFVAIGTAGQNATSFSDTTVEAGVVYYYRVRAVATFGVSGWSNVVGPKVTQTETVTWVGTVDHDWNNAANWSTGKVPNVFSDVVINTVDGEPVVFNGYATVNSLTVNRPLRIVGGTLIVNTTIQLNDQMSLVGGTIANTTINGADGGTWLQISGGSLSNVTLATDAVVQANSTLTIINGLNLKNDATLFDQNSESTIAFSGTQSISGNGQIALSSTNSNSGTIVVSGSANLAAVLTIGNDIAIQGSGTINGTNGSLVNQGSINVDVIDGKLTINVGVTNDGVITVYDGTLIHNGTWVNHGTMLAEGSAGRQAVIKLEGAGTNSGIFTSEGTGKIVIGSDVTLSGAAGALSGTEIGVYVGGLGVSTSGGYTVQVSIDGIHYVNVGTLQPAQDWYIVNNLDRNTTYHVRVVSVDVAGAQRIYDSGEVTTLDMNDISGWYRVDGLMTASNGPIYQLHVDNAFGGGTWSAANAVYTYGSPAAVLFAQLQSVTYGWYFPASTNTSSTQGRVTKSFAALAGYNQAFSTNGIITPDLRLYLGASEHGPILSYGQPEYVQPENGQQESAPTQWSPIIPTVKGSPSTNPAATGSAEPILYGNGAVDYATTDLSSNAYGSIFGVSRSWTNQSIWASNQSFGTGMINTSVGSLIQMAGSDSIAVVTTGKDVVTFNLIEDQNGHLVYVPSSYVSETLVHQDGVFILTDASGTQTSYYDFGSATPFGRAGSFISRKDTAGNQTYVSAWTDDGKIAEIDRADASGSVGERWLYSYLPGDDSNAGLLSNVQLLHKNVNGQWQVERQISYAYYNSADANGAKGDLKTATIQDGNGRTIDTAYYRYYTLGESGGYAHGLKYIFDYTSFARLNQAYADPFSATDAQIASYATQHFEYDAQRRVTRHDLQTLGSSDNHGIATMTYQYVSSTNADGANSWRYKTIETFSDGSTNTVYCNSYGQVILKIFEGAKSSTNAPENSDQWMSFYKYDDEGHQLWYAGASAITGYSETCADLLHYSDRTNDGVDNADYEFLSDTAGVIYVTDWYTADEVEHNPATENHNGAVLGYVQGTSIRHGELGDNVLQSTQDYFVRSVNGFAINPVANTTVYKNTNGTGAITTSYNYEWYTNSLQAKLVTVTLPTVTTAQNGSGVAAIVATFYDELGRPVWTKDADSHVSYTLYDAATGGVLKVIKDVKYAALSAAEKASFDLTGWNQTSGLNQVTNYEVDGLGRTTKITDPKGNISYITYDDVKHETRTYQGWNSSTNKPTGVIIVNRDDRANSYTETVTYTWNDAAGVPVDANGIPTGTELLTDPRAVLKSLSRTFYNNSDQIVEKNEYFNLSGLTYSTASHLGALNTNYYATYYGYDANGNLTRVKDANGTISIYIYDSQSRLTSEYVGINDATTDGKLWQVSNAAASSNMKLVTSYEYDNNGVGDGNLTKVIKHVDSNPAHDQVTQNLYDWRNRLIASKSGVQANEDANLNRALTVRKLDNLGQVLSVSIYDADGLVMADMDTNGVPDALMDANGVPTVLADEALRAKTIYAYDNWGRVYRTETLSVNQTAGVPTASGLISQVWYDQRGNLIKEQASSGLVTKYSYDGLNRLVASYDTDGGGDTTWADAGNVIGDTVLDQDQYVYDANGNIIEIIHKDRFHNATGTGELGDANSGVRARVSYTLSYYDALDRLLADVSVGTNGGVLNASQGGLDLTTDANGDGIIDVLQGTVPTRSNNVLVGSYTYTDLSLVDTYTDAKGIVTKYQYDDLGRKTAVIEAYTNGVPTNSTNRTTTYTYDGVNHVTSMTAVGVSGTNSQTTQYVYGVTDASGSYVNSNNLLSYVMYPNKSTGAASSNSAEQVHYTYNALGQVVTATDQNGTVHTYTYDILGTRTSDTVTTLGAGVDGSVRRVDTAYDTLGNVTLITSFADTTGTQIVSQIKREYNGLGQLTAEYQATTGAVDTATTPKVQYGYSDAATGSLLLSMTYPNGRTVYYNYNVGIDGTIGRLSSISDSTGILESYTYLGLSTTVEVAHPEAGTTLTYIQQSGDTHANTDGGDIYTGLDRFGRVIDQNWIKSDGSTVERYQYAYDRNGNVTAKNNLVNASLSESYTYDDLDRLTSTTRNGTTYQQWDLDSLGNSDITTGGVTQDRDFNSQNQIVGLEYDANGNTLTDEAGNHYVYDAWNHLVQVKDAQNSILKSYTYDALGRRITETTGSGENAKTTTLYYNASWQLVEERTVDAATGTTTTTQYVWSATYIDAMVCRDQTVTSESGSTTQRIYAIHDANFNVTAIADASGQILERYAYEAYGKFTILNPDGTTKAVQTTTAGWNYLHQGGRYDADTGLYNFRNRDYNPETQRWMQQDPLGYVDGANLYQFVSNNPITLMDPTGLVEWSWWGSFAYNSAVETGKTIGNGLAGVASGVGQLVAHPVDTVSNAYNNAVDNTATVMARNFDQGGNTASALFDGGAHLIGSAVGTEKIAEAIVGVDNVGAYELSTQERWQRAAEGTFQTAMTAIAAEKAVMGPNPGEEFSHAIPRRSLPEALKDMKTPLNGDFAPIAQHALEDPKRYGFMPRAWRAANPMPSRATQLWNRTPDLWKASAARIASGQFFKEIKNDRAT